MRHLPILLALASLQPSCAFVRAKLGLTPAETQTLVEVAQCFTGALFDTEQPKITTAVSTLPPETQALAQAAYAALQKSIDTALAEGVMDLNNKSQIKAQAALVALGQATDTLHATLHAGDDPVLAPIDPTLPKSVPTVAVPTVVMP